MHAKATHASSINRWGINLRFLCDILASRSRLGQTFSCCHCIRVVIDKETMRDLFLQYLPFLWLFCSSFTTSMPRSFASSSRRYCVFTPVRNGIHSSMSIFKVATSFNLMEPYNMSWKCLCTTPGSACSLDLIANGEIRYLAASRRYHMICLARAAELSSTWMLLLILLFRLRQGITKPRMKP